MIYINIHIYIYIIRNEDMNRYDISCEIGAFIAENMNLEDGIHCDMNSLNGDAEPFFVVQCICTWGFPKIRVPLNHPFLDWIFPL